MGWDCLKSWEVIASLTVNIVWILVSDLIFKTKFFVSFIISSS